MNETEEFFPDSTIMFAYEIKEFDEVVQIEDGKMSIFDDIMMFFLSISFSTTRGILFEKMKGTMFQPDLLPIVNTRDLLSNFKAGKQENSK